MAQTESRRAAAGWLAYIIVAVLVVVAVAGAFAWSLRAPEAESPLAVRIEPPNVPEAPNLPDGAPLPTR